MRTELPARVRRALALRPRDRSTRATLRKLVLEASGDSVRVGPRDEVFGSVCRVGLRVERHGNLVGDVLLLRRGTTVVALASSCPHLARTLDDAQVRGGRLVCKGHTGSFSLSTGRAASATVRRLGVSSPLRLLPVRSDGNTLVIDIRRLTL